MKGAGLSDKPDCDNNEQLTTISADWVIVEIQSKCLGVQGRGRHIPVPPEDTQEGMEKNIALGVGLEGRVGSSILDRGGSSRPGTRLEVKAHVERGDKAIGWMCHVAENRNKGDWSQTRCHANGLTFYSLCSKGSSEESG